MSSLNRLRKRNNVTNYSDDIYNQYIEDYQLYFDNVLNKTDYIDYYDKTIIGKGIILDVSFNNATNGDEKYITTLPNSKLYIGQILSLKFEDDIKYWLITEKEHLAIPSHDKFKMRPCNYILKWMGENGLNEQPCIVINNTKYTGGTKSSNSITEIDAMVNITISSNENTQNVNYGKRLFTMKNAWRVTLIDNITTENVFSWTLGKDSINSEYDNLELGICDYYKNSYSITLNAISESIQETSTYQVVSNVLNNGIAISNANIAYTSSDENIAKIDSTGLVKAIGVGKCIITATIGGVHATLSLEIITKSLTPVISYGYNFSQGTIIRQYVTSVLTTSKTIDGISNPLNVTYNWDSLGQSLINNKKLIVTTKNSSSIAIKNALTTTNTVIHLTAKDSDTGTIVVDNLPITLTGM